MEKRLIDNDYIELEKKQQGMNKMDIEPGTQEYPNFINPQQKQANATGAILLHPLKTARGRQRELQKQPPLQVLDRRAKPAAKQAQPPHQRAERPLQQPPDPIHKRDLRALRHRAHGPDEEPHFRLRRHPVN